MREEEARGLGRLSRGRESSVTCLLGSAQSGPSCDLCECAWGDRCKGRMIRLNSMPGASCRRPPRAVCILKECTTRWRLKLKASSPARVCNGCLLFPPRSIDPSKPVQSIGFHGPTDLRSIDLPELQAHQAAIGTGGSEAGWLRPGRASDPSGPSIIITLSLVGP